MSRIGAALIGCGKVGHTHAQALAALDEARFLAVYHPNAVKAAAFAGHYGVKLYSDLAALLAHPGLDMVTICTPHPSHPELAAACAQAGKHILVEKPMAVDLRGCDRMIRAADLAGIKLGVVNQRRFYEPVLRVRQPSWTARSGRRCWAR
jgi:predicted dehydrogenase